MNSPALDNCPLISVVAPDYDEAPILDTFMAEVRKALDTLPWPIKYEIILVNDGSEDGSAERLDQLAHDVEAHITVIHLCRNFGHSAAISAGLDRASGDAVILMDAD